MWGERGLIATFFADLHQLDDMAEVQSFLKMAGLFQEQAESHGTPEKIYSIIEPDFGNKGFGHPDAILGIKYSDRYIVVIVEAKRVNFEKACWTSSRRGEDKFNSKLNGQLELDYRLAMAFSKFKKGDSDLTEPEWVLATDYKDNLKGRPRSLQKPNVLKDVVSLFSGEEFDQYYYLVITTDEANPLDTVDKTFLPQLFNPHLAGNNLTFPNCWMEFRKQFGWLNYDKMKQFIHRIKDRLPIESLFLPTYEMNMGSFGDLSDEDENNGDDGEGGKPPVESTVQLPLKPPRKGVLIVKFKDKKCQLSCEKFSYALRYLQNRRWIELDQGKNDEKKMQRLLSQVEVLKKAPKRNRDDISFWEKFFDELGDC
jgi:hypothetical protein